MSHLFKLATGLLTGLVVNNSQPQMLTGGVSQTDTGMTSQALHGGVSQTNLQPDIQANMQTIPGRPIMQLQIPKRSELCAIGVKMTNNDHCIWYIDSKSDLVGQVQYGDRMLTINGEDAVKATQRRHNMDNAQTLVTVVIQHNNGIREAMQCRRHPISWFSQQWNNLSTPY